MHYTEVNYILLFLSIVLVNNVITSQFLGICPFLGVSKKVDTAVGLGVAVTFVLALASVITFFIQKILKFYIHFINISHWKLKIYLR